MNPISRTKHKISSVIKLILSSLLITHLAGIKYYLCNCTIDICKINSPVYGIEDVSKYLEVRQIKRVK